MHEARWRGTFHAAFGGASTVLGAFHVVFGGVGQR